MSLAVDDPRHGTNNGYVNLACRCNLCNDAHNLYIREYRARTGQLRRWRAERARRGLNVRGEPYKADAYDPRRNRSAS